MQSTISLRTPNIGAAAGPRGRLRRLGFSLAVLAHEDSTALGQATGRLVRFAPMAVATYSGGWRIIATLVTR